MICIKKINLFCELFKEILKSDVFIPKLGSRTFYVFMELCLGVSVATSFYPHTNTIWVINWEIWGKELFTITCPLNVCLVAAIFNIYYKAITYLKVICLLKFLLLDK
jgi:hypothetical protein